MSLRLSAGAFLILACFLCLEQAEEAQAGIADHLVVNEVQLDSIDGNGGYNDDWVEIYNPTASSVSLTGWSLQKQSQASTSAISKINLSGEIPAYGYFLVVRTLATTSLLELADITSSSLALADNNVVYLVNDNINIESKNDENIIDFVGMGSAENFEGSEAAFNPNDADSIVRLPDGEDTNDNMADFVKAGTSTPQNSSWSEEGDEGEGDENNLEGSVTLTVNLNANPVQNIGKTSADIVFTTNGDAGAVVNFGLDDTYGNVTAEINVVANTEAIVSLDSLSCNTTYHYSVYVENADASEDDSSADATFTTSACGITVDSLIMTKTSAKAKDQYEDGWSWEFDITVSDMNETLLKMKFNEWGGTGVLGAGGNMRFSIDELADEADWIYILDNNTYPDTGINIGLIDNNESIAGRQVKIYVQMKVPAGTVVGAYNSDYGISTEIE